MIIVQRKGLWAVHNNIVLRQNSHPLPRCIFQIHASFLLEKLILSWKLPIIFKLTCSEKEQIQYYDLIGYVACW